MSTFRIALRSLAFYRRTNFALALGIMAATAVLTGALVVGDSVRGSLRHLIIDRLGRIDEVLVTPRFFRKKLAGEIAAAPQFRQSFASAMPAILLQGSLESASGSAASRRRRNGVGGAGRILAARARRPRQTARGRCNRAQSATGRSTARQSRRRSAAAVAASQPGSSR